MPARKPKQHDVRSEASAVQRDVLQAAVDVCVQDWRQNVASHATQVVKPDLWRELTAGSNPDLCCGLSGVADTLNLVTGKPQQLIQWVVAAILQAHGVPPFLARVIGRLVANWLLAPVAPIGKEADRLRVLGVLLCVEKGDLAHCSCLLALAQHVAIEALKQGLEEGLSISPQPVRQATPRPAPAHFASVTYEVRAQRPSPGKAQPPPAARKRAEQPVGSAGDSGTRRDPGAGGSAAWRAAEGEPVAGEGAWRPSDSPADGPQSQPAANGTPATVHVAEDLPEAGSAPTGPGDDVGPDPRLVAACKLVRGTDWIPATAIFGATDGRL